MQVVAGIAVGLAAGLPIKVFFLGCAIAARVYGAWSVSRRMPWVQAAPCPVASALVLLS